MGEHSKDLPVTVDYDAEAMMIKLSDEPIHHTDEIIPCELNFDVNKNNEIIGIELLRKPVIKDITNYRVVNCDEEFPKIETMVKKEALEDILTNTKLQEIEFNLKEAIELSEYSVLPTHCEEVELYIHKTAKLYKTISELFNIDDPHQKYVQIYYVDGIHELVINTHGHTPLDNIRDVPFNVYISSHDVWFRNSLSFKIDMSNWAYELGGVVENSKPADYVYSDENVCRDVFLQHPYLIKNRIVKFSWNVGNDELTLHMKTENKGGFEYTIPDENPVTITLSNVLGEKTEVSKVRISDFSKHCNLPYAILHEGNVVIYYLYRGKYLAWTFIKDKEENYKRWYELRDDEI